METIRYVADEASLLTMLDILLAKNSQLKNLLLQAHELASAVFVYLDLEDYPENVATESWKDMARAFGAFQDADIDHDATRDMGAALEELINYRNAKRGTLRYANISEKRGADDDPVPVEHAEEMLLKAIETLLESNRRSWNVRSGRKPDEDHPDECNAVEE